MTHTATRLPLIWRKRPNPPLREILTVFASIKGPLKTRSHAATNGPSKRGYTKGARSKLTPVLTLQYTFLYADLRLTIVLTSLANSPAATALHDQFGAQIAYRPKSSVSSRRLSPPLRPGERCTNPPSSLPTQASPLSNAMSPELMVPI